MSKPHPDREIHPADAAAALAADPAGYLIVDCRLPEEFEVARVEGAVLLPLDELQDRLDEVEDALEARGLARDAAFAVLCHHGVRSLKATLLLQQHGFAGARSVFGGIELWAQSVDHGIPRYTRAGSQVRRL